MQIEGISYDIDWENFARGRSILIPCLDCAAAKKHVAKVTHRMRIPVAIKVVIEDSIKGLRIWRL